MSQTCDCSIAGDLGLAILRPAARWLRPLRSRRLSQAREFAELGADIHEWILVIMRADQKDGGSIVRRKCNHHPERSGKMRYTDLGEKIVTRQPTALNFRDLRLFSGDLTGRW